MKTNEIFEHVLQIVCEECELCYGELINGANKNAVDARCLLICALVSLGFSEENTAAYLSMTRQGVNKLKNSLKQRCSGSFILTTTNQRVSNSIQSSNCTLATQIADCCCKTQNAIERQGYETRIATSEQTHSLVDSGNENTRAILAKLDSIQTQALQDKITALTAEKATLAAEISQRNQNATILNAVGQQIAPLAAGLQALQSDVDGIKCKLPNTVPVVYPNIQAVNTDLCRAAAYGAYAGDVAYGRSGYGCGCNNYWG